MPVPMPAADARKPPLIAPVPGIFGALSGTGFTGVAPGAGCPPPFTFLLPCFAVAGETPPPAAGLAAGTHG